MCCCFATGTVSSFRKTFLLIRLLVPPSKGVTLHLQLHRRVLLEGPWVILPKHLSNPFARNTAGVEMGGVRRTEIIEPKKRKPRALQCLVPAGFQVRLAPWLVFVARKQVEAQPPVRSS